MNTVVETITGKQLNLLAPHAEQICLEDIIYSLSRLARYNGHTAGDFAYSVAQHSVWCAQAAMRFFGADYDTALKVLLHDAHEAYTGDLVTPLKACDYVQVDDVQNHLQALIYAEVDILPPSKEEHDLIKVIDEYALAIEACCLKKSKGHGWGIKAPPLSHFEIWQSPQPPMVAAKQMWNAYILLINRNPINQLCA